MQQLERLSSISEIRASTSDLKAQSMVHFAYLFQNQQVLSGERTKTEEELEVVEGICRWLPEFQRSFDVVPLILTPAHFHFMGRRNFDDNLIEYHRKRLANNMATLILEEQIVLINFANRKAHDYHQDLIELADTLSHEGIHFAAATIIQVTSPDNYEVIRTGLKEGRKYDYLNEKTTVELQREFAYRYYPKIPSLKKRLDHTGRYEHYDFNHQPRLDEYGDECCEYGNTYLKGALIQIARQEKIAVEEIRQSLGCGYLGGDVSRRASFIDQIHMYCDQLTINQLTAVSSQNPFVNLA